MIADERYRAIAVDIPIGLLDEHRPRGRLCDMAARLVVGMRIASIFTPPARIALGAVSYEAAKRLCSMSRQSYGLLRRIAELDALITPAMQSRVFETHPEVAFAALARRPWLSSKKTAQGRSERLAILAELVPDTPRLARRRERLVRVDDLLDATVAAAWRLGATEATPVGFRTSRPSTHVAYEWRSGTSDPRPRPA